jgi:hypothetical protein
MISIARRAPIRPEARPGGWNAQSVMFALVTTSTIHARSARNRSSV